MGRGLDYQESWVIVSGLIVGWFLHRCVARLPLGKSIVWPWRGYCEHCLQPLGLWNTIPLFGWLWALGRCDNCNRWISWRALLLPLITGGLFWLLYKLYFGNAAGWWFPYSGFGYDRPKLFAIFVYHAVLFSLLLLATFIDLDWMIIPDSVTVPGMILGMGLGTFWFVELHPVMLWRPTADPLIPVQMAQHWLGTSATEWEPWRLWINQHYLENWNRWLGFATGLMGMIVGCALVGAVRAICTWAFGREAIGEGDVTLMAMVGAFLGWQTVVMAFCLSPFSAMVLGFPYCLITRRRELPFGPHLSIATMFCVVYWRPLWIRCGEIFESELFMFMTLAMLVPLAIVALAVEWVKRFFLRLRAAR